MDFSTDTSELAICEPLSVYRWKSLISTAPLRIGFSQTIEKHWFVSGDYGVYDCPTSGHSIRVEFSKQTSWRSKHTQLAQMYYQLYHLDFSWLQYLLVRYLYNNIAFYRNLASILWVLASLPFLLNDRGQYLLRITPILYFTLEAFG
jgi:hypothetical protein